MAYALHDAARSGDLTSLTSLIAQGANLNQKDKHHRTPIHLAAWAGQTDAVKALIAAGCQVGAGAMDDMNALHFAAQKNSVDAARWLMNEGQNLAACTQPVWAAPAPLREHRQLALLCRPLCKWENPQRDDSPPLCLPARLVVCISCEPALFSVHFVSSL